MEIFENPEKERALIEKIIKQSGYTPDHNFDWLMYCADEGDPKIAIWDEKYAIWFYLSKDKTEATIVSDPISLEKLHKKMIEELVDVLFGMKIGKIIFLDVRNHVNEFCKNNKKWKYYFDYELIWPVLNMEKFDPLLPRGHFKSIRNAKNKFYKEHKIEIMPAESLNQGLLHNVVNRWHKQRLNSGILELYPQRYHNIINASFKGAKSARVMIVDDNSVGFNAGWETPNSPEDYSAAIGIHDFSSKDLGLILLLEDLEWIKNAGYKTCDLEGSEPIALKFKMQFLPEKIYKTYTFYVSDTGSSES